MREVDENAEVLPEVDALQPSSHSIEAGQSRTDLLDGHAHREADTCCAERVVNVEARRDGERYLGLAEWCLQPETRARRRHREVEWVQVGGGGNAVGPASRDRAARQPLVTGVVAVEHGGLLDPLVSAAGSEVDESSFRFEVVLPGRV